MIGRRLTDEEETEIALEVMKPRSHCFAGYVDEIDKERIRSLDIFFEERSEPFEVFTYRNGKYISYEVKI